MAASEWLGVEVIEGFLGVGVGTLTGEPQGLGHVGLSLRVEIG